MDICDHFVGEAVEVVAAQSQSPLIVLCDHASNAIPAEYGSLGLPPEQLVRHIAYDIGAAETATRLGCLLAATVISSRWSRLLIDLNRGIDDPTLVMRISDGAVVPGNRAIDMAERDHRIARFYLPYHAAIAAQIERRLARGQVPILVSIHTFTPIWRGMPRAWHAAVLWDRDPRLAHPFLDRLRLDPGLVVGDNEPYDGKLVGDTLWQHGTMRGLPHVLLEIRQDLVADEAGQTAWADRLAGIMKATLDDPATCPPLRQVCTFGS